MSREQTELRAERLRVSMTVLDALPDYEAGRYPEPRPAITRHDGCLYQTSSPADRELAEACLDAAYDLRRRQWAGLETLLAAIPPGGDLESIYEQPAEVALPAIRGAQVCGWLRAGA